MICMEQALLTKDTGKKGSSAELLGKGESADIFRFGNDRVRKVFKPGFFAKADPEYRKTRIARNLGLPAPELYGMTRAEDGNPVIEMEYIPGMAMSRYMAYHPASWSFLIHGMARLSAQMHSVSCDLTGEDAAFASETMDVRAWTVSHMSRITALRCILPEEFARMQRFFESVPEEKCFLHGDFDPSNIIVSEDGKHLRVIDFGDSFIGPWMYELHRMYTLHYDLRSRRAGVLRAMAKRCFFRYYLRILLRTENRTQSEADVLNAVGAMVNIKRLISCASPKSGVGEADARRFADTALKCIDALPDGVFPPDR